MVTFLAKLPAQRKAWAVLSASCFALLAAALFFQYQLGLEPCVKCIYQRTAVLAIGLAALIPLFAPQLLITRVLGFAGWLVASIWGWLIAREHLEIQNSENSWFIVCDTFPNFPSWMPLHEWFPNFFAAPGQCGEIDWQFAGLSMPGWMQVIFATYTIIGIVVLLARLVKFKTV